MKRLSFSRKQILRAIHAACIALFFAACATRANAAPPYSGEYTVNGSTVTGSGNNATGAYFDGVALQGVNTGSGVYNVTVTSGSDLGNTTFTPHTEIYVTTGSVNNAGTLTSSGVTVSFVNDGTVSNSGTIAAPNSTSVYVGGNATIGNTGSIQGNGDALDILGTGTITNSGAITSTNSSSIYIGGTGTSTVNNTGNIQGYFEGIDIVRGNGTVNNNGGSITSSNSDSVYIKGNGTVTNSGYMGGYDEGIYIGGNGTVTNNNGTITSQNSESVYIRGNGTVTNSGYMHGYDEGVYIGGNGTVANTGEIESSTSDGVYISGNGTVTNSGYISGYNQGVFISGTGTVTNDGEIESSESDGVYIGNGGTVTNGSGGYISGYGGGVYINGSGTVINSGDIESSDSNGVSITNDGTVTNYSGGTISGYNEGVSIGGNGTVINSGTISGGYDGSNSSYSGVYIGGTGTVNNNRGGTISGYYGVYINGNGTVNNAGLIEGDTGVDIQGNGVVNNTGTIYGYDYAAVYIDGTGLVNNSGTIYGDDSGVYGLYLIGQSTVNNTGTIAGYANGIYMRNGGTVNNLTTGSIYSYESNAIYMGESGTVNNSGYIYGGDSAIVLEHGGTVTNGSNGSLYSNGPAIYAHNNYSTVSNSGLIESDFSYGVELTYGGNVTLAGGSIYSDGDSLYLNSSSGTTTSTVTVIGRAYLSNEMYERDGVGTLNLNLVGLTPAKLAALNALNGDTSGTFDLGGGYDYAWHNLTLNAQGVSLEQVVDSGLVSAATAIDNATSNTGGPGLPSQFDSFYIAAAGNPEQAMNELVGRQIDQGLNDVSLSVSTQLTSSLDEHLDDLLTGNQIGGLDLGGIHVNQAGSMYAMSDTSGQLQSLTRLAGDALLGGTEMSTDGKTMIAAPAPPHWGVWASGNVTLGDQSNTSLPGYHSTLGSPTVGLDYRVTSNLVLGILGTYTSGEASFNDGSQISLNTEIAALYGTWRDGNWHVNGIFGGGWSQYDDKRATFGGLTAQSNPNGDTILTDWTAGYDFNLGDRWTITPEAGLQYTHVDINNYSESGAGVFDLNEGSQDIDSLRSKVGFKVDKAYSLGNDLTFIPELRAMWYHEFLDDSHGIATSLPGAPAVGSFSVSTYSPQRDFALVGVGLNTAFTGYKGVPVGLFLNYDAQVGQSDFIANSVNAGIRVDF